MTEQTTIESLEAAIQKFLSPEDFQEYASVRKSLENAKSSKEIADLNPGGFVDRMMENYNRQTRAREIAENPEEYQAFVDGMNELLDLQNSQVAKLPVELPKI